MVSVVSKRRGSSGKGFTSVIQTRNRDKSKGMRTRHRHSFTLGEKLKECLKPGIKINTILMQ